MKKPQVVVQDINEKCFLPREKLCSLGTTGLTSEDLFALLLGTGVQGHSVFQLAKQINQHLTQQGWLHRFRQVNPQLGNDLLLDLQGVVGIGLSSASKIVAAVEIGRRFFSAWSLSPLDQPKKIFPYCQEICHKKQEYCLALFLNGQGELIGKKILTIGGLNFNFLETRTLYETAFKWQASSFILAHNHPSGNTTPSDDDLLLTQKIAQSSQIIGVQLLDHLIVSSQGYISLREHFAEIFTVD